MGTMIPVALQAVQALQTVGSVAGVVNRSSDYFSDRDDRSSDLALQQLQARQDAEVREAQQKAVLDRAEIAAKAEEAEIQRRQALKRAVARQRVKYGASGVSSGDGSSEAVLLGLFDESEEEKQSRERIDNLRLQAIDQNLDKMRRVNTLERTQARERAKLKNSSSTLEDVDGFLSIF